MTNHNIGIISLGCPKALVDSENITTRLIATGYNITENPEDAELIIVNTCGFINDAINESLETIESALTQCDHVIVTGCLGVKKELILSKFPNITAITGPCDFEAILKNVQKVLPLKKHDCSTLIEPVKFTPSHYAYLKIAEGCNHQCTFCIIPQLRGPLKSRALADIMQEAENLVSLGVKELLIIAQDTAAYGIDLGYKNGLIELVQQLSQLGIWIRLHYLYPYPMIDEILPFMVEHKILPYLDVPFQHVNKQVLQQMKRPGDIEHLLKRIENWRKICPDLTIRSTFITGFPGETEEAFSELLDFLETAQLDRVGCFKYSPVEGALANDLPNQIPEELKQERHDMLMSLQSSISTEKLEQKIGQTIPVLIDEVNEDQAIGRTMGDAPEIDGQVIIENPKKLQPGDLIDIQIKDADEYDLYA